MTQQPYSVEQVANLLGLHVTTVRAYVREGRLKATRVGNRYRIARADLEAFTGHPVTPPVAETAGHRRPEVSSIVQIDAIGPDAMSGLSNTLMAAVAGRAGGDERLRVETIYDEERASMKIIIIGGLDENACMFRIISTLVKDQA